MTDSQTDSQISTKGRKVDVIIGRCHNRSFEHDDVWQK